MKKKIDNFLSRLSSGESGQALIIVLIFLMLGSLTLVPTLVHISTSLKTGQVYEENTNEMYAADSGIEDAIWRIKYDQIDPAYQPYDYSTIWEYQLDDHMNNATTNVTIQNVWIPSNAGPPADPVAADEIIKKNKLVVAGTSSENTTTCKIVVSFYPETSENLTVNSIGVWLPQGFTYVPGSSNLEQEGYMGEPFYVDAADVTDHDGGQAIVWDFSTAAPLTSFPGVDADASPQVTEITFQITKDIAGTRPKTMISWLATSDYTTIADILPVTWDVDTRIFKINSVSGDTEIEAYSSRIELRNMLDAIAGDYIATGNTALYASGSSYRNTWTNPQHSSVQTVSTIPRSDTAGYADVIAAYLYWSGWFNESTKTSVLSDGCTNFTNWDMTYQTRLPTGDGDSGGTWTYYPASPTDYWSKVDETTANTTDYITGTTTVSGSAYRLFTFSPFTIPTGLTVSDLTLYYNAKDFSSATSNIRTSIKVDGSRNNGTSIDPTTSWAPYSYSYTTSPYTNLAWTVADINGSGTHPLQQFGVYSSDLDPDVLIANVYARVNYSCWGVSSNQFRAHGSSSATAAERTITLKTSQNIDFAVPARTMISWDQTEDGTLESDDGLDYSFSTDGGSNWSENFEAFRDDLTTAIQRKFKLVIPTDYKSSTLKIRFKLIGFNESDDNYCYVDNIKIEKITPDNSVTFKIKNTQTLVEHTETITADKVQVLPNSDGSYNNWGYSYSSFADVTSLVNDWCETAEDSYHNVHLTGNAEYTVGEILASTNDDWSYAGWSIIIVYSSPKTAGHQLYLYDDFMYADMYMDVDFDSDGEMGGTISGFKVPEKIVGDADPNAGKLTCFIGEGDLGSSGWGNDFIAFNAPESKWKDPGADPFSIENGYKLYDGMACWNNSSGVPNNVWNNKSIGLTRDGIDIDTFNIPWATEAKPWFLESGDSSAHIDMPTQQDSWNLVYMILSFRSKTVIGGTTHYVIHND